MQKLRHPVAMFIVTVLAVIGIGVGIVAATTNQKVYGPSWGRFTASFSGRVYQQPATSLMGSTAVGYASSVIYEGENPDLHGRAAIEDHVSAQHVSEFVLGEDLRTMRLGLKDALPVPLRTTRSTEQVNGFLFFRLGPLCARTFCEGVWIVVQNRTIWVLMATSFLGVGPGAAFLYSFQPIG